MKKENLEEGLHLQGDFTSSIEFLSVCIFNTPLTCISEKLKQKRHL